MAMIEGSARLTERKFVALRKSRRRWSSVGDLEAIAGVKSFYEQRWGCGWEAYIASGLEYDTEKDM